MTRSFRLRSAPLLALTLIVWGLDLPAAAAGAPDLTTTRSGIAAAEQDLVPLEQAVLGTRPGYRSAYRSVEALGLSAEETRQAAAGDMEGLDPARVRVIEEAVPALVAHDENLEAYFTAYDDWATLKMDEKVLEVLADLDGTRAEFVASLGEGALGNFDEAAGRVREHAKAYWTHRDVLEGRDSWRRYADLRSMSASSLEVDEAIRKLGQRMGTTPRPGLRERVRSGLAGSRRFFQRFRLGASTKVPMAKIVAHLANPLAGDPDRVSSLLQDMGRRYVKHAKIDIEVVGRENLPDGRRVIVAPSHRNVFVDPFTMFSVLDGPITVIQTILWFPGWAHGTVKKWTADEPGVILAHTEGVDVIGRCEQALRSGRKLLFFPEGNIPSPLGEIRRLRSGLLNISARTLDEPVSVVPVTLEDPVETWGSPAPGTRGRELGARVKVVIDPALDLRTVHAVSGGRNRMLLNLLREFYHKNLIRTLSDAPAGSGDDAASWSEADELRRERFLELHAP